MPVAFLDPDGDSSPLQWTPTPSGTHYTTIDDGARGPPDATETPDTTDYISHDIDAEADVVTLEDAPADYGTITGLGLHVYGEAGNRRKITCTLEQADGTVLLTVSITVEAAGWNSSTTLSPPALSKSEIDGLVIRFKISAVGGPGPTPAFVYSAYARIRYDPLVLVGGFPGELERLRRRRHTARQRRRKRCRARRRVGLKCSKG